MSDKFNESTFSFAYTHELIKRFGFLTVPEFLAQHEESINGYDVMIKGRKPIFLQFKISHFLTNSNAAEYDSIDEPYYRFKLHRSARKGAYNQHNLLLNLNRIQPNVYYCAPIFHKKVQLFTFFRNSKILENSVLFSPMQMGSTWKTKDHKVIYNPQLTKCFFLSEPKVIEPISFNIFEKNPEIELNRDYWMLLITDITYKMMEQIDSIDNKQKKSSNLNRNNTMGFMTKDFLMNKDIDHSNMKNKIVKFTKELERYDYVTMVEEIEEFLLTELNIQVLM